MPKYHILNHKEVPCKKPCKICEENRKKDNVRRLEWQKNNKKWYNVYMRKYMRKRRCDPKFREKEKEIITKWRNANRDYWKEYYQKHKEAYHDYYLKYIRKNPNYWKKYYKAHIS